MDVFIIPDFLVGDQKDEVNIFFYLRENGPDQIKLKLNYSQNMLCFMIRGVKEIVDNAKRYRTDENQIALVTSGNMLMSERVTLKQDFESLLLFFSNEYLISFLTKHKITFENEFVKSNSVINFPKDDYLVNFQQSMKILEKDFTKKSFRHAKMEEVLLYLIDKYPDKAKAFLFSSMTNLKNNVLLQVVQNHKFKKLNSEELAFLCNMSLSTFKRKFFDTFKMSPKKYLISERMKKAEQLLKLDKSPTEIYYEVGYENLSSFSLEFKKYFGLSPKYFQLQN